MSTFQITLSNAQSKKLYAAFGNALIEKIFSAENGRKADQELRAHCEAVLTDQLAQVGKKTPVKKAKKAKTSPAKDNSPSKTELKKQQLNEELVTLGGEALPDAGVLEIRKAIKLAKKAAKVAAKEAKKAAKVADKEAKKAAKEAKKAKKPKKAKKAKSPSKTELKKQQLNKDLVALGGEALPNAGVLEIRKAIKLLQKAAKKAAKAATPKVAETSRRLKDKDGNDVRVDNDETKPWLRVAVNKETREVRKIKPESWTAENNALFDHFYPDSKDPVKAKKAKKAPKQKKAKTLSGAAKKKKEAKALRKAKKAKKAADKKAKEEAEKKDLVAKLVAEAAQAELDTPTAEEVETIATIAAKADEEAEDSDTSEEQLSDGELSEEELSEDEQSDSDDDDEPVYDEDDVQPWTHKSRPDEELFIDSDFNVWNDEQEFVGTFDSASDTLVED